MWYQQITPKTRWALALLACLAGGAHAATLTVGPAPDNTYLTLELALAAADSGDVIILDEAGSPYVLTAEVVINTNLSPLRIQGQFNNDETPDEIVIEGAAGAPVFTVETGAQATFRHLTITGGTTGIQALNNSQVTLERVYVSETGAEGMTVTNAEQVDITSSIFNACGGAGLEVNNGTVDVTQSTFIDNTGLAIDLQSGTCEVSFSLFYNNNGSRTADQLDAAVAGLDIDYCYVDGGTPAIVNVAAAPTIDPTVTTAFAGDPETDVFDSASTWRGQLLLPIRSGNSSTPRVSDAPFGRDFIFRARDAADAHIGAHEFGAVAGAQVWVDCVISQNGVPLEALTAGGEEYAAAGFITIEVFLSSGNLQNAVLYLAPENGNETLASGRVVIPLNNPVPGSENYSTTDYFIDPDHFVPAQDGTSLLLDGVAELFLQVPALGPAGVDFPGVNADNYGGVYGPTEPAAEAGRIFVIDTVPPQIVGFGALRAHEYVVPLSHNDTYSPADVNLMEWSANGDAPLASSTGKLDPNAGGPEPHVFFNNQTTDLNFTIRMVFIDANGVNDGTVIIPVTQSAGFAPAPAPESATGAAIYDLLRHPDASNENPRGQAWWEQVQPLPVDAGTGLTITYTGGGGANLTVEWAFTGVPTDLPLNGFWEAIAQFGAQDLAGNVAGANPGNSPLIQGISPFHIWQMAFVSGAISSGPGGRETQTPVINWGVQRFGVTPVNTDNAYPVAQYTVYGRAAGDDPNTLGWTPLDGNGNPAGAPVWSDWISVRRIDQYTLFTQTPPRQLGNIIQTQAQYMIVVRTADEAGNEVDYTPGTTYPNPGTEFLGIFNGTPYVAETWTNGGASIGLDTRISPTFWHNATGGGVLRDVDPGERRLGAASRVPLPAAATDCVNSLRVEGNFIIEMALTDNINSANAGVYFELFEDGALAASGFREGGAGNSSVRLVIPEDLLAPPAGLTLYNVSGFLNFAVDADGAPLDCDGSGTQDRDRLGDEGFDGPESPFRKRDVRYRLVAATALNAGGVHDPNAIDPTPATVEFTVTVDRGLQDDQPIKSFVQE